MNSNAAQFRAMAAQYLSPSDSKGALLFYYAADAIDEREQLAGDCAVLRTALKANHDWHQQADEHDAYADSSLCERNLDALRPDCGKALIEAAQAAITLLENPAALSGEYGSAAIAPVLKQLKKEIGQ